MGVGSLRAIARRRGEAIFAAPSGDPHPNPLPEGEGTELPCDGVCSGDVRSLLAPCSLVLGPWSLVPASLVRSPCFLLPVACCYPHRGLESRQSSLGAPPE